jgi:anti-sigma factor RsiW
MNAPACDSITFAALTDYAAGELPDVEAAAIEDHLFSCAGCSARAAEFEALLRAIPPAVRTADISGFVTDALLNQLARQGMRVRTFTLSPGAMVPCAVWDDDEVMALRLRADFSGASEVTLTQHVAGTEVVRATSQVAPGAPGELIYLTPAALVRQLPVVHLELRLTASVAGEERTLAHYTLAHGGFLRR